MSKRKLDINQIKKQCIKNRNLNKAPKYQSVFSLFKHKQGREIQLFNIKFPLLIRELLEALISYDLFSKIGSKEPLKVFDMKAKEIVFEMYQFKGFSSEYPLKELLNCLVVRREEKEEGNEKEKQKAQRKKAGIMLSILDTKLIHFFKKLRNIYQQFCIGDKLILQQTQYQLFYQSFKVQWAKKQQKGRQNTLQKLQKRLVRSLFVFIILIQNNIMKALDEKQKQREKKQKEKQKQLLQIGTKSQKKNIQKYHSVGWSKNSTELISNFSLKPLSIHSYDEIPGLKNDLSQKSLELNVKNRKQTFFDKIRIGNLKFKIEAKPLFQKEEQILRSPFINLLEDGVENVLIQEGFRIAGRRRRISESLFSPSPSSSHPSSQPHQNMFMPLYPPLSNQMYMNPMYNYQHPYPPQFIPGPIQIQVPMVNVGIPYVTDDMQELHQMRRSMDFFSPVHMSIGMNKVQKRHGEKPKTPRENKSNKTKSDIKQ